MTSAATSSITSNVATNAQRRRENGSGGLVAVADVDSDINGTDNNTAFIGADFVGGGGIVAATPPRRRSTGPDHDQGRRQHQGRRDDVPDDVDLRGHRQRRRLRRQPRERDDRPSPTTRRPSIGKNAHVTGSTVALIAKSGGSDHGTADAFALAFFGSVRPRRELDLNSNATALLDGDSSIDRRRSPASTASTCGRYHDEPALRLRRQRHLHLHRTVHTADDPTNVVAQRHGLRPPGRDRRRRAADHPRRHDERPALERRRSTPPRGDTHLALYVQAEQTNSDADSAHRATIHWNSDVVIYAGPSPLLIIGPDGKVADVREHHGQRRRQPGAGQRAQRARRTSRSTT